MGEINFSTKIESKHLKELYGPVLKIMFILICVVTFILLMNIIFLFTDENLGGPTLKNIIGNLIPIIILSGVYYLLRYQVLSINKFDAYMREKQHYTINNEGFFVHTELSNFIVKWDMIEKVQELKKSLFIYYSNKKILIIPKDDISQETYEGILELVKEKVKNQLLYLR